jgi:CO dehydrogenase/acetyl-CoA synthase delta subunit
MVKTVTIVFIIRAFCGINSPKDLNNDIKADCFDYMNNCITVYNKETTEEVIDSCKENWATKEVELRRELNKKREQ